EQLGFSHLSVQYIILDQFPIILHHTAHSRPGSSTIDSIHYISNRLLFSFKHWLKTFPFNGTRDFDTCQITKSRKKIQQVDIALYPFTFWNVRTLYNHGDPPR